MNWLSIVGFSLSHCSQSFLILCCPRCPQDPPAESAWPSHSPPPLRSPDISMRPVDKMLCYVSPEVPLSLLVILCRWWKSFICEIALRLDFPTDATKSEGDTATLWEISRREGAPVLSLFPWISLQRDLCRLSAPRLSHLVRLGSQLNIWSLYIGLCGKF